MVGTRRSAVGDFAPAVMVHGLLHARSALSVGRPVMLLSAPGAALYAGCGWWRALMSRMRTEFPAVPMTDMLDCGDGAGQALAALRIGQQLIVLSPAAPGWAAVAAVAAAQGGRVLAAPPPSLDLGTSGAARKLHDWLREPATPGDSAASLG